MCKKIILGICLALFFTKADAQDCFKDCMERMTEATNNGITDREKVEISMKANMEIVKALIGCKFPGTLLKEINGKTITVNDFKGKPVFVKFWFASCPPCIAEIEPINKLVKEFGDTVKFLSISTDDETTLKEFLSDKKFNTLHAYFDRDKAAKEFCAIGGYPFNLILDQSGIVKDVWSGGNSYPDKQAEFYERVKKNLKELVEKEK
jgi:peroxiredoxin